VEDKYIIRARPFAATMKRRKTFHRPAPKLEKLLLNQSFSGITATQVGATLFTCTTSCTLLGLMISGNAIQAAGTGPAFSRGALVIVRDGYTANTMLAGNGPMYKPEEAIWVFWDIVVRNNTNSINLDKKVKTKRKLKEGDTLQFMWAGSNTDTTTVDMIVQFWSKTN